MSSEFYKELRNPSRKAYDRYKNCKLLEDIDTGEILVATREVTDIPVNVNDTYHRVKVNEVSRLDMLAHQYYQNPLLWWVIAQANNISDPMIPLEVGTIIRIPSIETLYGNNGVLL